MARTHSLVIGGTRGLGHAIVNHLRGEGHAISILSRNLSPKKAGNAVFNATANITSREQVRHSLKKIIGKFGPLNDVVLTQRYRGIGDPWEGEIDTTLTGTRNVIELAKEHFAPKGAKSIVVVSSIAGQLIVDSQPASYHMSKAALEQLVRYYAATLGSRGIRVNAIAPGSFVKEESRRYYLDNARRRSFYRKLTPLGRMVTTVDIACVVRFLVDPACRLTGQTLVMDGGASLLSPETIARRMSK